VIHESSFDDAPVGIDTEDHLGVDWNTRILTTTPKKPKKPNNEASIVDENNGFTA